MLFLVALFDAEALDVVANESEEDMFGECCMYVMYYLFIILVNSSYFFEVLSRLFLHFLWFTLYFVYHIRKVNVLKREFVHRINLGCLTGNYVVLCI